MIKRLATFIHLLMISFLVIILLFGFLTAYLQLSKFNNFISQQLTALMKQPVRIEGAITPRFLPKLGVHFKTIRIGSDKTPDTAVLENVTLSMSTSHLLKRAVVFRAIKIGHLSLRLTGPLPIGDSSSVSSVFQLKRCLIKDGEVEWRMPNFRIALTGIQLAVQAINFNNQPFPIELATTFQMSSPTLLLPFSFQGQIAIPPAGMSQSVLQGQLNAANMLLGQYHVDALSSTLQTKASYVFFNPLKMHLYGGTTYGDISVDLKSGNVLMNQFGSTLKAEKLLHQLWPQDPLSGSLSFSTHTHLNLWQSPFSHSITGNGSVTLKEGSIHPFNLNAILKYAAAKLHRALDIPTSALMPPIPPLDRMAIFHGYTPIKALTVQYRLQNINKVGGLIAFQNESLKLTGVGSYSTASTMLHGALMAEVQTTEHDLATLQKLLGGRFPLQVAGSMANLRIEPNVAAMMPFLQELVIRHLLHAPIGDVEKQIRFLFEAPNAS